MWGFLFGASVRNFLMVSVLAADYADNQVTSNLCFACRNICISLAYSDYWSPLTVYRAITFQSPAGNSNA